MEARLEAVEKSGDVAHLMRDIGARGIRHDREICARLSRVAFKNRQQLFSAHKKTAHFERFFMSAT